MKQTWWKEAVIYQIYPRSFKDSNGDGIGDLPGIVEKLDYLQALGIDMVWFSPIYASPNVDNGYDISNYYKIMDELGTMQDWETLLEGLHSRGIKMMLDLVINHTSDQHEWFQEAKSSKTNPKRDFYIWRQGKEDSRPNNWKSFFTVPAWSQTPETDDWYLHLFDPRQPDLNWKNSEVREEIYRMMRWWLDKGVDGFRMDVINLIAKDDNFADFPNPDAVFEMSEGGYANRPGVHDYLHEMYEKVLKHYNIVSVGECVGVNPENGLLFSQSSRQELHMPFAMNILWEAPPLSKIKKYLREWAAHINQDGWYGLPLGAHDYARQVSRFGNDQEHREVCAKALATLLLTNPGTPFLYQGDEIGMTNVAFSSEKDYRDIQFFNEYEDLLKNGKSPQEALLQLQPTSRDNSRTPMQWTAEPSAGFTTGTPWIKVNPNYLEINVENNETNPHSILQYYRQLIAYRKTNKGLIYGKYQDLLPEDESLYCVERTWEGQAWIILLNYTSQIQPIPTVIQQNLLPFQVALSNVAQSENSKLIPWEARVYQREGA